MHNLFASRVIATLVPITPLDRFVIAVEGCENVREDDEVAIRTVRVFSARDIDRSALAVSRV